MNIDPDDPKLTAYALDELDEAERAAIAASVEQSLPCQLAVDEIRHAADWLQNELQNEPCPEHVPGSCLKLESEPRRKVVTWSWRKAFAIGCPAAIAACIALAFLAPSLASRQTKKQVVALNDAQKTAASAPALSAESLTAEQIAADTTVSPAPSPSASSTPTTLSISPQSSGPTQPAPQPIWDSRMARRYGLKMPDSTRLVEVERLAEAEQRTPSTPRPGGNAGSRTLQRYGLPYLPQRESGVSELRSLLGSPKLSEAQKIDEFAATSRYGRNVKLPAWAENFTLVKFSPDGRCAATAADDTTARICDAQTGKPLTAPLHHNGRVTSLHFSPDGRRLVTAAADSTVRIWDVETGKRLIGPLHQSNQISSAQFSPDGQRVVTTSSDGAIRLWDVRTGQPISFPSRVTVNTAVYERLEENAFLPAAENPLSTFSIDVDTASYANVRRFLNQGQLPPEGAVRVEELINYFTYDYPPPKDGEPFSVNLEVAGCPWNQEHRLVCIGLKGREMAQDKRPSSNFVFLIDVSGSMQPPERLPLIKQALRMFVRKMTENDRVAIVVYASSSGLVLPSTSCAQKEKILEAIVRLEAGGSTNGGEGIQLAYRTALENFIKGGVNRVILCTDGDFNVGITDPSALVRLIEEKARSGVFLTALGVGTDNFKDATMQKLADEGNGNYHYLDSLEEAQKVLIQQMNGTLVPIAKDVKIQIEFNPAQVSAYRLIGYEKRRLRNEDFNDDTKDAGEIGAGHTVTALYEIVPAGKPFNIASVDPLKYRPAARPAALDVAISKELLTLKLRFKQPDGNSSKLLEYPMIDRDSTYTRASRDFKFAAAVASFGMLLRDSEHKGTSTFDGIAELAEEAKGKDTEGYRAEFLNLVMKAKMLKQGQ